MDIFCYSYAAHAKDPLQVSFQESQVQETSRTMVVQSKDWIVLVNIRITTFSTGVNYMAMHEGGANFGRSIQ